MKRARLALQKKQLQIGKRGKSKAQPLLSHAPASVLGYTSRASRCVASFFPCRLYSIGWCPAVRWRPAAPRSAPSRSSHRGSTLGVPHVAVRQIARTLCGLGMSAFAAAGVACAAGEVPSCTRSPMVRATYASARGTKMASGMSHASMIDDREFGDR